MTIAVSLKINDGLVLAADSATTVVQELNGSLQARNVYNNANKIFNLYKGLPIGAITWGAGSIGGASISTLVKDFRQQMAKSQNLPTSSLSLQSYQVRDIAQAFRTFIYEDRYIPAFERFDDQSKPVLGFIIAGYSTDSSTAEEYQIDILSDGTCADPQEVRPQGAAGASWAGQPQALNRLLSGFDPLILPILQKLLEIPDNVLAELVRLLQAGADAELIHSAMPLQDAIDLARFMVDTTSNWCRFAPGVQTVGGPTEIAAITRHEGFRWIERKHYFKRELNTFSQPL